MKKDSLSWIVFFFISIGFHCIFVFNLNHNPIADYSWPEAISTIVNTSAFFTLYMVFPVYINLLLLKKKTIDDKKHNSWSYVKYLLLVIANGFLFSGILEIFPPLLIITRPFLINLLFLIGVQLIASGMKYSSQVWNLLSVIKYYEHLIKIRREEFKRLKEMLSDKERKLPNSSLTVGTLRNYWIIPFVNILYLEAKGNEPDIYTNDEKKKYPGSESLYYYEDTLPQSQFIRVHRSYIVNKKKVMRRRGNKLFLRGTNIVIPIGSTYENIVNNDPDIGL